MNGMARKYSMETRNEEGGLLRRRVMDAAFEVLGEVGAERLTMDMVARHSDAATRTVYNHFESRQELLAAGTRTSCAGTATSSRTTSPRRANRRSDSDSS
jgi:AcrR family transcriptional regulator